MRCHDAAHGCVDRRVLGACQPRSFCIRSPRRYVRGPDERESRVGRWPNPAWMHAFPAKGGLPPCAGWFEAAEAMSTEVSADACRIASTGGQVLRPHSALTPLWAWAAAHRHRADVQPQGHLALSSASLMSEPRIAAQTVFARVRAPGIIEIPGARGRRSSPVSLCDTRTKETGASFEVVVSHDGFGSIKIASFLKFWETRIGPLLR